MGLISFTLFSSALLLFDLWPDTMYTLPERDSSKKYIKYHKSSFPPGYLICKGLKNEKTCIVFLL